MRKSYFITPNFSVAFNAKAGSSTLSRAIIKQFWPERENTIQTAAYPEGLGPDNTQVQFLCPTEYEPSNPVVLVVREPLSRFRSSMAQLRMVDVDIVLDCLENGTLYKFRNREKDIRENIHFGKQSEYNDDGVVTFKFEHLNQAAEYIGLDLPLPIINSARNPKPTLTSEQEARVLAYYLEDLSLYNSAL